MSNEDTTMVAPGTDETNSIVVDSPAEDPVARNEIIANSRPQPTVVEDQAALTGENAISVELELST